MKKTIAMLMALVLMLSSGFTVSAAAEAEDLSLSEIYLQAAREEIGNVAAAEQAMKDSLISAITTGDAYRDNLANVYAFYDQMVVDAWDIGTYLRQLILTGADEILAMDLDNYGKADLLRELNSALGYDLRYELEGLFLDEILYGTSDYFQSGLIYDAFAGMDEMSAVMSSILDYSITRSTRIRVSLEIQSATRAISHLVDGLVEALWNEDGTLLNLCLADYEYALNERMGTLPEGSLPTLYGAYQADLNSMLNTINTEFNAFLTNITNEEQYLASQDQIHAFYDVIQQDVRAFTMRTLVAALENLEAAVYSDMTDAELKRYVSETEFFLNDQVRNEVYSLIYQELGDNLSDYFYNGLTQYCSENAQYWDIRDAEYEVVNDLISALDAIDDEFSDNASDCMEDISDCIYSDKYARALAMIKLYHDEFAAA